LLKFKIVRKKLVVITGSIRDRTAEFLLKFGERGESVLRAALEYSEENENKELGDFSYKGVVDKLIDMGYNFDPKMLLRSLEKDFGITETTYKSSNQHWWKFLDKEQVSLALSDSGQQDPRVRLIFLKFYSLDPKELQRKLEFYSRKTVLSEMDKKNFRKLVFEEIEQLTQLYDDAIQYEETQGIAKQINKLLTLAYKVGKRIYGKGFDQGFSEEEGEERKDNHAHSLRLPDSESDI
jgi:hypothetical protein